MGKKNEGKLWQRWNAPNGEHIWQGNIHIADITGEDEKEIAEVAKFAVVSHNACINLNSENPLAVAEAIGDMYEALKELVDTYWMNKGSNGKTCPHPKEFIACITPNGIPEYWKKAENVLAKIKGDN